MKPVLRTVIDKNGGEETVFAPTAQMILYSIYRAENPGMGTSEVCKMAGIAPSMPGKWAAKYSHHFMNWIEEALDANVNDDAKVLERIGMINATQGNFQFWREMARTKGVIKEEAPKRGLTLNTDFTVILAAVGGDFNAARQHILSAHRGVEHQGDAGLVHLTSSGEHPGAGAGASPVQREPVAVSNPLGANRRRAKRQEPIPAFSEQATSPGSDPVLDD